MPVRISAPVLEAISLTAVLADAARVTLMVTIRLLVPSSAVISTGILLMPGNRLTDAEKTLFAVDTPFTLTVAWLSVGTTRMVVNTTVALTVEVQV